MNDWSQSFKILLAQVLTTITLPQVIAVTSRAERSPKFRKKNYITTVE